jgi:hypothetical protein
LISYQLVSTLPPKQASVMSPPITPASVNQTQYFHPQPIKSKTLWRQRLAPWPHGPMAPWPHGPATGACGRAPVPLHVSCAAVGCWMLSMLGLPRSAGAVSCKLGEILLPGTTLFAWFQSFLLLFSRFRKLSNVKNWIRTAKLYPVQHSIQ